MNAIENKILLVLDYYKLLHLYWYIKLRWRLSSSSSNGFRHINIKQLQEDVIQLTIGGMYLFMYVCMHCCAHVWPTLSTVSIHDSYASTSLNCRHRRMCEQSM